MRDLDDIDLLVLALRGLEPREALDLIRWNIGWAANGLPHIDGYKAHMGHPSFEWWLRKDHGANKIARAAKLWSKK